jgi:small subunit ribosomal protein S18
MPNPNREPAAEAEREHGEKRKQYPRRKVCRFCQEKMTVNYKDVRTLASYISEHGKILPRRMTGTCAKHQRLLAIEIKKARIMALLPYSPPHI